ncbi:transposase [Streptomyces solisilvae]|uniref:transposase n=1 Tax=Streptomyces malaysiensis TaxID=92644 RepID=UPI0036C7C798
MHLANSPTHDAIDVSAFPPPSRSFSARLVASAQPEQVGMLRRHASALSTSARADADLVLTTLEYALASREVAPGELIHHADHGCQYTSVKLTTRLVRAGIQASMGSVGDSFDNALAENLWMITKTECIRGRVFATRAEANLALFEYIDGFYNPRRIQKRLGYLSPIEYEEKHYANQATAEQVNLKPRQPTLTS